MFPNARGGILAPHNVGTRFWDARGSEFAHVKLKTFRSTAGTMVARAAGPEAAALQLEHVSPAITARHYIQRAHYAGDHALLLDQMGPPGTVPGERSSGAPGPGTGPPSPPAGPPPGTPPPPGGPEGSHRAM